MLVVLVTCYLAGVNATEALLLFNIFQETDPKDFLQVTDMTKSKEISNKTENINQQ